MSAILFVGPVGRFPIWISKSRANAMVYRFVASFEKLPKPRQMRFVSQDILLARWKDYALVLLGDCG